MYYSSEDVPSFSPSRGSLYNNVDGNPVSVPAPRIETTISHVLESYLLKISV